MKKLSASQIEALHDYALGRFGGLPGVRDPKLLESAAVAPYQTFDGKMLYPSALERAAKLAQGLIGNHPFNDGNKRTGVLAMGVHLELEGITLTATNDELIEFGLTVAKCADLQYITRWLLDHTIEEEHPTS